MRAHGWRRIATGTWGWPSDPQIYGRLDVDATAILDAIERIRARTGVHVSVTHVVVRALAHALAEVPELNTKLSMGRFVPREGVNVFVIVSTGAGRDLSGVKVTDADQANLVEVARVVEHDAGDARSGGSSDLERGKQLLEKLPLPALRVLLRVAAFLTTDLGLDLRRFGLPREAFGSAMVSSVGMFGITEGWAPLSPLYRVPLLVLIGRIRPAPWVQGGTVAVRQQLPLAITIDHRWVDGHQISRLAAAFKSYLADPLKFEPPGIAAPAPTGGRKIRSIDLTSRTRR